MSVEWSMERVAQQYRDDIQACFERENAAWHELEREDVEKVRAKLDAARQPYPDWLAGERDSFYWEIYSNSEIKIANNSVQVILPNGFAIRPDFVEMFGESSVTWSIPNVSAIVVDGEAFVTIELILIDYWDDERQAKWLAEHNVERETT